MKIKKIRKELKTAQYEVLARRVGKIRAPFFVWIAGLFSRKYREAWKVRKIKEISGFVKAGTKSAAHILRAQRLTK